MTSPQHQPAASAGLAPAPGTPVQHCVVPDFDGGELDAALAMFEELLLVLRQWEQDAQEPDGDRWRPPAACAPQPLLAVHGRLWQALRPTQSRDEWRGIPGGVGERVEVEPAGPQWRTTGGYQLAALSFVDLPVADVDALGALAAALTAPVLDAGVRQAVEAVDEQIDLHDIASTAVRESERAVRGAISSVARLHALLTVALDRADLALLQAARAAAGDGQTVWLDATAEAAWHRVVNACHRAFLAHDPLARWAMGNSDHT